MCVATIKYSIVAYELYHNDVLSTDIVVAQSSPPI